MISLAARWCGFYHPFPLISLEISLMTRPAYPTDLTDAQWAILAPMIPAPHKRSRPRKADMREVVNAILYLVRGGNSWRAIPHDLAPWQTTYYYFTKWQKCGVWKKIHDKLLDHVRIAKGRKADPSVAILDSQSVKTTEKGGLRAVTMLAKRLKAASDILPLIPLG